MEPTSIEAKDHHAVDPIPALPEPVVITILQLLPQRHRLACAALVCKSWAAAAAAATTDVVLPRGTTTAAARGLCSWVQQHGRGAVGSIRAPHLNTRLQLKLRCAALAKLAKLHLHNCALELDSDSAEQGGSAIVLPALRCLSLNRCTVPLDTLSRLECPQLTGFQLLYQPSQGDVPAGEQLDAALFAFLQRLPGLVQLALRHSQLDADGAALAQLSCLQQLQDCTLCCSRGTPAVLAHLTTSLTSLTIREGKGVLQEGSLPGAGWPHLKELTVSHCHIKPVLLSRLTTLERLSLSTCVLWAHPERAITSEAAAVGAAQLLAAVAQLKNLKKLNLINIRLDEFDSRDSDQLPGDTAAVAAAVTAAVSPVTAIAQLSPFSALTASGQLESLTMAYRHRAYQVDHVIQPLPSFAADHMFPPGRQLSVLTELVLDAMDADALVQFKDQHYTAYEDPYDMAFMCLWHSDLDLLLAACPRLQRLTLNSVMPRCGGELDAFLHNAQDGLQLSYLCLGGLNLTDTALAALAGLIRLQELELHNAPQLTPDGVKHLTALRKLSGLRLNDVGCLRGISCNLRSTSKTDQPDVWQQLERELPGMRERQQSMQYLEAEESSLDSYGSEGDW